MFARLVPVERLRQLNRMTSGELGRALLRCQGTGLESHLVAQREPHDSQWSVTLLWMREMQAEFFMSWCVPDSDYEALVVAMTIDLKDSTERVRKGLHRVGQGLNRLDAGLDPEVRVLDVAVGRLS